MTSKRLVNVNRNVFKCGNSNIAEIICDMWLRDQIVATPVINMCNARSVVIYAQNLEQLPISVCIQSSYDGRNFINDPEILCLEGCRMDSIVPCRIPRFMRAVVVRNSYINKNYGCNQNSRARLWFIVER
ncbi:MAG: hypothetical protein GX967_04980 [Clostridiales bacterium]|nr:hypothetical protein [Clostridiales bacterium]